MTPDARKRLLDGLGLVDWRMRPDRLAAAPTAPADHAPALREPAPPATDPQPDVAPAASSAGEPAAAATAPDHDTQTVAPNPSVDAPAPAAAQAPAEPAAPAQASDVSRMDWDELEAWLATRDHRGASRPVFGIGARDADVLIVGEAPGANEDAQGVPFVGRAGKLLDRMLFAIGCSRDTNVYITNICKFRPPNNRDPNADEVAADWPVLERQIELMDPKLVVAVGRVAAQTLLDSTQSLGKLRGTLHRYPRRELDVLVTYHPAFLLRSPGQKAKAWTDLKQIARRIASA